tara:strand:- start:4347 stop:4724 length:378 start_codon:yes stop_codon:yes gene_type:complete
MTKLWNNVNYHTSSTSGDKEIIYHNGKDYDKCVKELEKLAKNIENAKRPGYTQANGDVLANFRKAAELSGTTPMQAWGVYFYKHVAAIMSYAKDPTIPQAEDIEGRFADAMNYLKLGFYILKEDK